MRLTWLAAEERTTTKEHVVTSILSGHSLIPFVRGNRQMLGRHVDLRDVLGEHEKLGLRLTSPDLAYIPIDHATGWLTATLSMDGLLVLLFLHGHTTSSSSGPFANGCSAKGLFVS